MRRTSLTIITALLAMSGSRGHADSRKARADKRFQEARAVLAKGRCTRRGCPDFAAGAARLRQAFELSPRLDYASYYCRAHEAAWKVEKLGSRGELVALAMCDAAWVFHEQRGRRAQARRHALAIREARRRGGRLSDPVAAAGALYGVGLKLTESGGSARLAYGDVDASALQAFIRDYYYPHAAREKLGVMTLVMPREKVKLCKSIAGQAPRSRRAEIEQLCEYRAALEANRERHGFVGLRPVRFKRGKTLYAVSASLRYVAHLGIAGSGRLDTERAFADLINLLGDIDKSGRRHRYYREAQRLRAEMEDAKVRLMKEVARAERRLGRGNRVLFFPRYPGKYRLPDPLKGHAASCDDLTARVYARRGYVEVTTEIDGQRCSTELGSRKVTVMPRAERYCKARILAPGKHTVKVTAYATRWRKTGERVNVHRGGRVDIQDTEDYRRGRRVAGKSITCGR